MRYFLCERKVFVWANLENCGPIDRFASNQYKPRPKIENIDEFGFGKSASVRQPDMDPDLISVCVLDTRPNTTFLCLFHPFFYWVVLMRHRAFDALPDTAAIRRKWNLETFIDHGILFMKSIALPIFKDF